MTSFIIAVGTGFIAKVMYRTHPSKPIKHVGFALQPVSSMMNCRKLPRVATVLPL